MFLSAFRFLEICHKLITFRAKKKKKLIPLPFRMLFVALKQMNLGFIVKLRVSALKNSILTQTIISILIQHLRTLLIQHFIWKDTTLWLFFSCTHFFSRKLRHCQSTPQYILVNYSWSEFYMWSIKNMNRPLCCSVKILLFLMSLSHHHIFPSPFIFLKV